jgi:hypothetical protein
MDFPENQKTGTLAEIKVEELFLSWGWNIGHDRIDAGYDLCVTPPRAQFKGACFRVQVKGTAKAKGNGLLVAPVSKDRLRQYAEDVVPVFLVRANVDGLFWIHAQAWTSSNPGRLIGSGSSGVRFAPAHVLEQTSFEAYLRLILHPNDGVAGNMDEEVELLNALDPKLGVRIRKTERGKEFHLYSREGEVDTKLFFSPSQSAENLSSLRDAIEFGLPREIDVDDFRMAGSPLFEQMGIDKGIKGKLAIVATSEDTVTVRIYPGHTLSVTAQELTLKARMFRGTGGVAITNEDLDGPFNWSMRVARDVAEGPKVNFGLRETVLTSHELRNVDSIRPLSRWSDQVMTLRSLLVELEVQDQRLRFSATGDVLAEMAPFVQLARIIGRLHLVAKALDSPMRLPADFEFSASDVEDIDLAYHLLRGERPRVNVGPVEFEPTNDLPRVGELYWTTTLSLSLFDQPLGDIPVCIECSDFQIEAIPGSSKFRISKGETGVAWISYFEHEDGQRLFSKALQSGGNRLGLGNE